MTDSFHWDQIVKFECFKLEVKILFHFFYKVELHIKKRTCNFTEAE